MNVKKAMAIVALSAGAGLMSSGVALADDVVVGVNGIPIPYTTENACISDGPDTHLDTNDSAYPYWYCVQGAGNAWYLHNTDNPG